MNDIKATDWNNINPNQNAWDGFSIFHSMLKSEYNKAFPIVKIKKKYSNQKLWLTNGLKESIKKNNELCVNSRNKPTWNNVVTNKWYKN